jgi:hypothetical protein
VLSCQTSPLAQSWRMKFIFASALVALSISWP